MIKVFSLTRDVIFVWRWTSGLPNPRVYLKFCKFDSRNNLLNIFVQHHVVERETKCNDAIKVTYTIEEKTRTWHNPRGVEGGGEAVAEGRMREGEGREMELHNVISVHLWAVQWGVCIYRVYTGCSFLTLTLRFI